ncbi:Asp-tRNA(Asn)/Glu-tRNA(Gln) amidotransferase subunit GatB [Candidatus Parcubacteria bacterium]|nr:Asp-tRNA(Asn)/Glu-tRNA(Gln) amidotransferase subunit GatB [Candidatus Parcubacteria bacterium]
MSDYKPTIGLEIHAELRTRTKMFCDSANSPFDSEPNTHICPVCLGYPGTLPVINKEAVRQVLRVGAAAKGKLADYTEFDRKNYFYPDIPKGYQISQYKHPLVEGGEIAGVKLTRIHLEEDTANSKHSEDSSLVDFNRAGVPLMELVTEPVIHDAVKASDFAKELQLLLRYLGASEANMEKGEMRVEANISISKDDELGTKVEVKNLNSFRAVEKAIKYEVDRQTEILERGERVAQETRGWDENKEATFSQRAKEESHDYRYFPDPDLPKLFIGEIPEFALGELAKSLPELPWERRERYMKGIELTLESAESYTRDIERGQYLDKLIDLTSNKTLLKLASNYIATNPSVLKATPESVIATMQLISDGEVSSTSAKIILKELEGNNDTLPRQIAEKNNLIQMSNESELRLIAEKVIAENPNVKIVDFLVGQGIKATKGRANPQVLKKIFSELV